MKEQVKQPSINPLYEYNFHFGTGQNYASKPEFIQAVTNKALNKTV
jgi:hypothetical protein